MKKKIVYIPVCVLMPQEYFRILPGWWISAPPELLYTTYVLLDCWINGPAILCCGLLPGQLRRSISTLYRVCLVVDYAPGFLQNTPMSVELCPRLLQNTSTKVDWRPCLIRDASTQLDPGQQIFTPELPHHTSGWYMYAQALCIVKYYQVRGFMLPAFLQIAHSWKFYCSGVLLNAPRVANLCPSISQNNPSIIPEYVQLKNLWTNAFVQLSQIDGIMLIGFW